MNSKKYICAVGDSFVFGDELVTTHYASEFEHLSKQEYTKLQSEIFDDSTIRNRYFKLLDSMRFTSVLADRLGYNHINFAQCGASQEAIKLQAHLLLHHLKICDIKPSDTEWVIGITSPTRAMMLSEANDIWINQLTDIHGDLDFVFSRFSGRSLFIGDKDQISPAFTKEYLANFTTTNYVISWIMNLVDIAMLLKSHSVKKFIFVNSFSTLEFIIDSGELPDVVLGITTAMLLDNNISQLIVPSIFTDLDTVLDLTNDMRCPGGHYDKKANQTVANFLYEFFQ